MRTGREQTRNRYNRGLTPRLSTPPALWACKLVQSSQVMSCCCSVGALRMMLCFNVTTVDRNSIYLLQRETAHGRESETPGMYRFRYVCATWNMVKFEPGIS